MTLVEFLLARIEDDEADARRAAAADDGDGLWVVTGVGSPVGVDYRPSRVLAECGSKRSSLRHLDVVGVGNHARLDHCDRCRVLRLMASVYADHPDYRTEWRP